MSKQNKSIQEKLESRAPATMRQIIKPVDMLEQEQPERTNERANVQTFERSNEQKEERTNEHGNERTNERSEEQTDKRTNEHMNVRTNERTRMRHSFDIYEDQLISLKEIAIKRQKATGKRILLGDLAQEALDTFIEANK